MRTKIPLNAILALLFPILALISCRTTDTDNSLTGKLTLVKINLTGTEFVNTDAPSSVASIDHKGLSENRIVQLQSTLVSPSSFITAELTPDKLLNTIATASKDLSTLASVSGDPIGAGMKFRVIAYRQNDGSYQTYQDYTVGQSGESLKLDGGIAYNIVVYSYGVNTLPAISSGEQSNINNATVNYDDTNRDFMYQKISYTPNGNNLNNILNIKLRHKLAQITTIINSGSLGDITNITSGALTPHYSNGVFSLSSGTMSGRSNITSGATLNFSPTGFPGTTQTASPVFINEDTNGSVTGNFSASITIGGTIKINNLLNYFKITPGKKGNLTINFVKCGAFVGQNTDLTNFKEFMCQNLGATVGINPFSPEAGNLGAKYQWGANTNETGRYISQSGDQSNSGSITGWISTSKANGSWSDTSKTTNDPCPSGYRVPTMDQWQNVIDNNPPTRQGSWPTNGIPYYGSVIKFGNYLSLPAAGIYRSNNIGMNGDYWSSSYTDPNEQDSAIHLIFDKDTAGIGSTTRPLGLSIRCIKE